MNRSSLVIVASAAIAFCGMIAARSQGVAPAFLKVSAAAPKTVVPGKMFQVSVVLTVDAPYHIQANPAGTDYIPTVVTITPPAGFTVGKIVYPKPVKIKFSGEEIPVYTGKVTVMVPITSTTAAKQGTLHLPISVAYQGCNDSSCFPPTKLDASIDVKVGKGAPSAGPTK